MTSKSFVVTTLVQRFILPPLLFLIPLSVWAQTRHTDTLFVHPGDSTLRLSSEFIRHGSDIVVFNGDTLRSSLDYDIDVREGRILLRRRLTQIVNAAASPLSLVVSYVPIPVSFEREYFLKTVDVRRDTTGKVTRRLQSPSTPFMFGDFFSSSMQKSGSLLRGFTIGSNRDLTLTSGFRMQMSGQLSRDVDVVAVLTDENTPLQPEGTTQTLQEVDKVFVEFTHPSAGATLGDFNEHFGGETGGEFGRLIRKLQGARGKAETGTFFGTGSEMRFSLSGGSPRGKYLTSEFLGREGNQGPYRLTGAQGERQIIIVAGSERVYIDGVLMTRGEVNDYVIEYASAEITFTSQRLITNSSRIVVDYEYSDRSYERNFFSASMTSSVFNQNVRINAIVVQETDDSDAPIDVSLDDATRSLLAQSGADPLKASRSGVQFAGRDSLTDASLGQYVRKDTVIGGTPWTIFVYSPGDSLAVYTVSFSPVEQMPPDSAGYERIALGHFRFAGLGQGSHLPLRIIPLPALHRLVDVNAEISVLKNLSVTGEFAASRFDRNRLSKLDDGLNDDRAMKLAVRYNPKQLDLLGMNAGEFDLLYTERFVGGRFMSVDRVNEIEFDRKWNIEGLSGGDERIREISAVVKPAPVLSIGAGYGSFERGFVSSERREGRLGVGDSVTSEIRYRLEQISAQEKVKNTRSMWFRHGGVAAYQLEAFRPAFRVEAERRDRFLAPGDSLAGGSFRFIQWSPSLQTQELFRMRASAEVQFRAEDSSLTGILQPSFSSVTQIYNWQLLEWNDLFASVTLSARKTRFEAPFKARGNNNSDIMLVRSQVRHTPLQRALQSDLFYEFSNQRSARLERVYVRVAKGEGNYRYLGDRNNNTVADDDEFELTRFDGDYVVLFLPAEELYPVASLKSSARVRFQPSRIIDKNSFLGSVLDPVSTETYLRIDERSSDPRTENIYLLKLRTFLNRAHTIAGSQLITQDLHLYENDAEFSSRFRFSQRRGLLQLVSSVEESFRRERSVRVRSQLIPEIGNQSELIERVDRLSGSEKGPRDRDLRGYQLSSDFSYRPERDWEVGFRFQFDTATDRFGSEHAIADMNEQSVRVVYAFLRKGQLRTELSREEVVLSRPSADPGKTYTYEFTQGRSFGKTFLWSVHLDYRIAQNVQMTLQYNGRSEGGRDPVHFARAEAKAFF